MNSIVTPTKVPVQLLNEYEEGDFYLSSPGRTLLGKGVLKNLASKSNEDHHALSTRVMKALAEAKQAGVKNPIVAGAIPFAPGNAPQLIIPESFRFSSPHKGSETIGDSNPSPTKYHMCFIPAPEEYMNIVEKGLVSIHNGELEKLVLSRTLSCHSEKTVDSKKILQKLVEHNKSGYTYAVNLVNNQSKPTKENNDLHHKRTFIGASPELLVSKTGKSIIANPLAGSRPRCEDPTEDAKRVKELLASKKDLHEHRVVVDAVVQTLKAYCPRLVIPEQPSIVQTETMWHLSTEISGELFDSNVTSLDIALALHPTPAVCGYPREQAYQAIQDLETFNREYFTGIVGWVDEAGDGEWIVAIRCAEIEENTVTLYAGAGVVTGSNPDEELKETSAKFRTMLNAIGLEEK